MLYVTHTCKNSKRKTKDPDYCFNAFVAEDYTNAQCYPPTWRYCPDCEAKGFSNEEELKKKQAIYERQRQLRMESLRKLRERKKQMKKCADKSPL